MADRKGFICAAHRDWLTSNPSANMRIWDESLEVGKNFLLIGELSNAENALSAALESAEIYFSRLSKIEEKQDIEMFAETVSELVTCLSFQGELSKRDEVIGYGVEKLQLFLTMEADRTCVLKACHLLMNAQQIEETEYTLARRSTDRIHVGAIRTTIH